MAEIVAVNERIIRNAKDLDVFKRAYQWSLYLHKLSLKFPAIEQKVLANQLRRSSKSVCANIVEGFSRQSQSKQEFKRYLTIAIGSAEETQLWIMYAYDLGYITKTLFEKITRESEVIIGMLVKFREKA